MLLVFRDLRFMYDVLGLRGRDNRGNLGRAGPTENVPVQVEDGLARGRADVDQHAVVGQADFLGRLCDKFEHPLGFSRIELPDIAEGVDMALGNDQNVHRRLGVDVVDRNESLALVDVGALAGDLAEKAVLTLLRHGSPPP